MDRPLWNRWPSEAMAASSPEALPQLTSRPLMASENSDWGNRAVPTWSNTMSTPRPPVTSMAQAVTSPVRLLRTWSAPISSARSHLASVPAVASTTAPACLASWMPATDTPDPAAWIITVSPAARLPVANRAWPAVSHTVGKVAASSIDTCSGTR